MSWAKFTKTHAVVTADPRGSAELRIDGGAKARTLVLTVGDSVGGIHAIVVDQEDLLAALTAVIEAKTVGEA